MKLLTQNSKLKKDGIFNFDIPAYKSSTGLITCPNASSCIANCYARQGTYMFSNVKAKHEANLQASLQDSFVSDMVYEIKKRKVKILRISSAGDFYSQEYANKWLSIAKQVPDVFIYAYTKSWNFFDLDNLPSNMRIIQSQGGKLTIDKSRPHAVVFKEEGLIPNDYADASHSDMVAIKNDKVALVYHGTKRMVDNGFIETT